MKKDIILGLDVGIASVGWCITDKNDNSIVKHGVRLFDTVDHPRDSKLLNETRRQKRSERRMNKRRFTLKRDFIKFLIENKYVKDIKIKNKKDNSFVNEFREKYLIPMDKRMNEKYKNEKMYWIHVLRKKALTKKIEFNQILSLLYWYLSNRGFKYEEFDPKEISGWKINPKKKENKFPIDLQIENFKKTGRFKSFFNRNFHKNDYVKELKTIFKIQNLDQKLTNAFLNESNNYKKRGFFIRQRDFETGPGSIKSPTPYGIYQRDEKTNKVVRKYDNIWQKTVGKCSLYPSEYRAPKGSFSAEVFNLLNDLNNLTIGLEDKKLTLEDKLKILKISFEVKSNLNKTIKYIIDKYKTLEENISGFRVDKKRQLLLTKIESYPVFKELFGKVEFDFDNFENFTNQIIDNKIDSFVDILSQTKEIEKRNDKIKKDFNVSIDNEKLFKEASKIKSSQTHSLSYKALREYIPELLKQNENYSTLSYEKRFGKNNGVNKDLDKNQIKNWINEELVASPSVKRSLNQTFLLLKAITKHCKKNKLNISKIVVEMTRETNNKRKRENIENFQKHLESKNKKVFEILQKEFKNRGSSTKNGLFNKIYLWDEQDGFDVYDGKPIDINDLRKNPNKYDIDHILPKSKSFDDSINNKVLTKSENNSDKGNKTPYKWLSNEKFLKLSNLWQQLYGPEKIDPKKTKKLKYKNRKKLENLLSPKNFDDPNEQLGFIQRNFVDTSYVASSTINKLKEFFKDINIQTINGKMTSFARKNIESFDEGLLRPKDAGDSRDKNNMKNRIWHGHHAEDAYLITLLSQTYKDNKIIEKYAHIPKLPKGEKFNFKYKERYQKLFDNLEIGQKELNSKMNDVAFSRKIELNSQLKGSEENLTGGKILETKNGEKKLESFKYIYLFDLPKEKCEKYFGANGKNINDVFLKENKSLYDSMCKTYEIHKESKYPFKQYFLKDNDPNKKYSEHDAQIKFTYKNKNKKDIPIIVKKIKVKDSIKDIEDVFFGNQKNLSENKMSFYSGLNWLEIHVYKNRQGNYKLIPINLKNSIFKKDSFEIIDEKLNQIKKKHNIDKNQKSLYVLKRNDIISKDNIEYFICGLDERQDKLELKFLKRNKNPDKNPSEKNQMHKTINTFLSNSFLLKKDFLGNIVSRKKIFIK